MYFLCFLFLSPTSVFTLFFNSKSVSGLCELRTAVLPHTSTSSGHVKGGTLCWGSQKTAGLLSSLVWHVAQREILSQRWRMNIAEGHWTDLRPPQAHSLFLPNAVRNSIDKSSYLKGVCLQRLTLIQKKRHNPVSFLFFLLKLSREIIDYKWFTGLVLNWNFCESKKKRHKSFITNMHIPNSQHLKCEHVKFSSLKIL